jgi:hypothetical protein
VGGGLDRVGPDEAVHDLIAGDPAHEEHADPDPHEAPADRAQRNPPPSACEHDGEREQRQRDRREDDRHVVNRLGDVLRRLQLT